MSEFWGDSYRPSHWSRIWQNCFLLTKVQPEPRRPWFALIADLVDIALDRPDMMLRWWSGIEAVQMTDPSNDITLASEQLWQSLSHQWLPRGGALSHSQHGNWVIHLFEPIAIWSGKRRISQFPSFTSNVFLNGFYLSENLMVKAKWRDPLLVPWEQPISSGIRFVWHSDGCITRDQWEGSDSELLPMT